VRFALGTVAGLVYEGFGLLQCRCKLHDIGFSNIAA
jgi:hypothetical protein